VGKKRKKKKKKKLCNFDEGKWTNKPKQKRQFTPNQLVNHDTILSLQMMEKIQNLKKFSKMKPYLQPFTLKMIKIQITKETKPNMVSKWIQ
jgi:hypothetical protein